MKSEKMNASSTPTQINRKIQIDRLKVGAGS